MLLSSHLKVGVRHLFSLKLYSHIVVGFTSLYTEHSAAAQISVIRMLKRGSSVIR